MSRYPADRARAYEAGETLLFKLRDELDHIERALGLQERLAAMAAEVVQELRFIRRETADERHLAAVLLSAGHDWPHGDPQFVFGARGAVEEMLTQHRARKAEAAASQTAASLGPSSRRNTTARARGA